ncbi:MAG: hypothetical protein ABS96_30090 [Lysobacteraceae bacterium SCN 69-123]|nr:MAG: hypothetical protein ABS96_30090 [Xanthomonadaceae bacterium SCN 69-123]OJY75657.1 MAG: hypothetical protein BGP18_02625 [Stenotrophomonas sp. 69-14]
MVDLPCCTIFYRSGVFYQAVALRSGQFLQLLQARFHGPPGRLHLFKSLIRRSTLSRRFCQLRLKLVDELPQFRYLGQCQAL